MIHLYCAVPGCAFECTPGTANRDQYNELLGHFAHHQREAMTVAEKQNLGVGIDGLPGHPTATSPSVVDRIWAELDRHVDLALDWPKVAADSSVWDSETDEIAFLKNELEKTKAAAAGRGLAIALSLMMYAKYPDSNAVMAEAMTRRQQREAVAAAGADEAQQVTQPGPTIAAAAPPSVPASAPEPPAQVAPATAAPVAPTPAELTPEQVEAIRNALEGGFDPANLATAFKIPVEQIQQIADEVAA